MKILVDGMDLTGKSTLAFELARTLRGTRRTGALRRNFLARAAERRYRSGADPSGRAQTWLFAASALGDARAALPPGVLVQEAWVEHTIALAQAFDRPIAAHVARLAALALPRFDVAILLVADRRTRRARLASRKNPDVLDRLLVDDPARAERIELGLHCEMARRYPDLVVLDSARLDHAALLFAALHAIQLRQRYDIFTKSARSLRVSTPGLPGAAS